MEKSSFNERSKTWIYCRDYLKRTTVGLLSLIFLPFEIRGIFVSNVVMTELSHINIVALLYAISIFYMVNLKDVYCTSLG
jgi:hypothetical protein